MQRDGDVFFLHASSSFGAMQPVAGGEFGGSEGGIVSPSAIPLNTWSHLAMTYDGGTLRLYVNGVQVATDTFSSPVGSSTGPLWIGGNDPWGQYFIGVIDDVRVYDRVLSAAEIQADMALPVGGTPAVNTPPTISGFNPQSTTPGAAVGPLPFTVGDAETAAGSLTIAVSSSNTTLVPLAQIVIGGSGAARTVTVTPAAGLTGSATITLTVSDGTATASESVLVNVIALPVTEVSLVASPPGPQPAGTAITWTAAALGGLPPYQYRFYVQLPTGVWQLWQDWSATPTTTWTPTVEGAYHVSVWAKRADSQVAEWEAMLAVPYTVSSAPPPCTFTLDRTWIWQNSVSGGGSAVTVTPSASGCVWTRSSPVSWVTFTDKAPNVIDVVFTANPGLARSATVTIAGHAVPVVQDGSGSCSATLDRTGTTVGPAASDADVQVSIPTGCGWIAHADASWLTVTPRASQDSGVATVLVAANPSSQSRTATVTIAHAAFTVEQRGIPPPCTSATFNRTFVTQESHNGAGSLVRVIPTPRGCVWTAVSQVPWLGFTTGSVYNVRQVEIVDDPDDGDGTAVDIIFAPNAGVTRATTLTIAGVAFPVEQYGQQPCSYSNAHWAEHPTQLKGNEGGDDEYTLVASPSDCGWIAHPDVPWLTVTPQSGNGTGAFRVDVARNYGGSYRDGHISIGGLTLNIRQNGSGGCQVRSISKAWQRVDDQNNTVHVEVEADEGCFWWAESQHDYLRVNGGTAVQLEGHDNLEIHVENNTSVIPRTGLVTIGNRQVSISQAGTDGASCDYQVTPAIIRLNADGDSSIPLTVATSFESCEWRANPDADFMQVTNGHSGTGPGSITLSVGRNQNTTTNKGILYVATSEVDVEQAPESCAFSVSPTDQTDIPAAGDTYYFTVSIPPGCGWEALWADDPENDNDAFFTVDQLSSNPNGPGQFRVVVSNNPHPEARIGRVEVHHLPFAQYVTIHQLGLGAPPATGEGEVSYFHTDAIGSVRLITNQSGAVVQDYNFAPFGVESGNVSTRLLKK